MSKHDKDILRFHREYPIKEPITPPQPFFEYPISDDIYFNYCAENLEFDPSGSYTGLPDDKTDQPVQDADDL